MELYRNGHEKKPKIAIMHFSGPPNISGVDLIIRDQARLFRLHNYRVELVTGTGKAFRKDIPLHINKLIDPKNPDIYKIRQQLEKGKVTRLFHKTESKLYRYLKSYLVKNNIQVVFVHNIFTRHYNLALTSAITRLSKELPNVKFVIWIHDITFFNQPDLKLNQNLGNQYPWNNLVTPNPAFTYICVSEFLKKDISHSFTMFNHKYAKNSIKVIPNTHDIQKFMRLSPPMRQLYQAVDIENSDLVIAIPVRAVPRKRLDFAIDVIKEMLDKGLNAKLLMTANMDKKRIENIRYFEILKKKVAEEKISDHVFFLEEYFEQFDLPHKPKPLISIPELFIISDALLLASSLEGFGMPLIEAGLMRCPIFASDILPFREIGSTNINYFKLTDSPKKVAEYIMKTLKSMPQSYFYRKVIRNYSMHKIFRTVVIPLVEELTNS